MARSFTRRQALQNADFLAALRRTGNVREAARELGVHRSTFTKRRAKHPAFAADWDAALAIADAAVGSRGGPSSDEPRAMRTRSGRLQLRRAQPRRLTRAAEQRFLAALSATANIRLSAAAAGFSHSAFYARRKASPAFAREMRLTLLYEARKQREREKFDIAEAGRRARGEPCRSDRWKPQLPDLAQVTGWSKAKQADPAQNRALFGGWRREGDKKRK